MQYKIPQNVQMEDRIIGPITMKQLIILGVGGAIAYVLYTALARTYYWEIWLPPVGILGLITIAVAFIKINDIPFIKYAFLLAEYFVRPQRRVWQKTSYSLIIPLTLASSAIATSKNKKTEGEDKEKKLTSLEKLSSVLDSNNFSHLKIKEHEDLEKTSDDNLISQAFFKEEHDFEIHTDRLKELAKEQDLGKIDELKRAIEEKKRVAYAPPKNLFESRTKVSLGEDSVFSRFNRDSPDKSTRRASPVRKNTHINNLRPLNSAGQKKTTQPKPFSSFTPPKSNNNDSPNGSLKIEGTIDFGEL